MNRCLESIVSALCTTFLLAILNTGTDDRVSGNSVTRFVLKQFELSPNHVRVPLSFAVLLFGYSCLPFYGCSFLGMNQAQRLSWVYRWKAAHLSPFRDFVRYFEGLSTFFIYSQIDCRS